MSALCLQLGLALTISIKVGSSPPPLASSFDTYNGSQQGATIARKLLKLCTFSQK